MSSIHYYFSEILVSLLFLCAIQKQLLCFLACKLILIYKLTIDLQNKIFNLHTLLFYFIDAAGYVHEIGSAVKNLKVGDRVFVAGTTSNSGSYAQFVVSDDTYVFPLHDRLTMQQGASLGVPFFTAYKALILRAQTRPGEVVLIHGASGAVGTAAVQIARALGATVVGTAGTKEGMDVVSRCGAHHVFNHNHKSYEKKMLEHLGTGFDVIIEHLANINLGHDLQMLKNGARVMIVGCRGTANINPRHLMLPEASIR